MNETITITGNVATDPQHKRTESGVPITTFRVASGQRRFDKAVGRLGGRRDELVHRLDLPEPRRSRVRLAPQGRSRAADRTTEGARLGYRREEGHDGRDRRGGDRARSAVGDLAIREGPSARRSRRESWTPPTTPSDEWAAPGVTDESTAEWTVAADSRRRVRAPAARARRRRGSLLSSQAALGVAGPRLSPCPDTPSASPRPGARHPGAPACSWRPLVGVGLHRSRVLRRRCPRHSDAVTRRRPRRAPLRRRLPPPRPSPPPLSTQAGRRPTTCRSSRRSSPRSGRHPSSVGARVHRCSRGRAASTRPRCRSRRTRRRSATRQRASSSRCTGATSASIGQVGPATGAPVTVVVPALTEGRCLVGETRPDRLVTAGHGAAAIRPAESAGHGR